MTARAPVHVTVGTFGAAAHQGVVAGRNPSPRGMSESLHKSEADEVRGPSAAREMIRTPAAGVTPLGITLEPRQVLEEAQPLAGQQQLPGSGMLPTPMRPASAMEWWGKRKKYRHHPDAHPRVSDADGKQTGQRHLPPTMLLWAAARRAVTGAE
jgi:hypothetical protein